MRLKLWLKKSDGRTDDPEWFVKDVANLDDPYQAERFNSRTFSDNDKFVEGVFLANEDLTATIEKAEREAIAYVLNCYSAMSTADEVYASYNNEKQKARG